MTEPKPETIGELHDRLEPDVWYPMPGVPGWRVKRLPGSTSYAPGGPMEPTSMAERDVDEQVIPSPDLPDSPLTGGDFDPEPELDESDLPRITPRWNPDRARRLVDPAPLLADLAAMTARAESAEAERDRLQARFSHLPSARELSSLAEVKAGEPLDRALLHRMVSGYQAMTAELEEAQARATFVDITQLGDNGTRTKCCNCGHEQFTPASPPYAPQSAREASSVDAAGSEGQRGSESVSGGTA